MHESIKTILPVITPPVVQSRPYPQPLTKEQATQFFADFYSGEHHLPGPVQAYGEGWFISSQYNERFSTVDHSNLTRLVIMAHDRNIRVELSGHGVRRVKIVIHNRLREGDTMVAHPTMEEHLPRLRTFIDDIIKRCRRR